MNEIPDGVFVVVFLVGLAVFAVVGQKIEDWIRRKLHERKSS